MFVLDAGTIADVTFAATPDNQLGKSRTCQPLFEDVLTHSKPDLTILVIASEPELSLELSASSPTAGAGQEFATHGLRIPRDVSAS